MIIQLSHKIRLYPTVRQEKYFLRACGTARFTWNWALAEWKKQYVAGVKVKSVDLKKQFNAVKYDRFPWLESIHRDAHSQPFANLQKAFIRFFKHQADYPKFHKKGIRDSFYVANDKFSVIDCKIKLPIIGNVHMAEALRFKGRKISATISRTADKWFVSIAVEIKVRKPRNKNKTVIGVDLGIKNAVTLSDGTILRGPKPLKENLEKLVRKSRQFSRKQKGSQNRNKAKMQLGRLHVRISSIRNDFLNKATTDICRENQVVVIEDLNVKGMTRNHRLARSLNDVGFGEFRRQLTYKASLFGVKLIVVDRWFPSSKMCSKCGALKDDLTLADRVYRCACGNVMDRDMNAAKNLATVGYTESVNPRIVKSGLTKPVDTVIRPARGVASVDEAGIITCTRSYTK